MPRIDAHQHFWHYQPEAFPWIDSPRLARDFMPPQLTPLLDAHAIDGSIAVQARPCEPETDWLLTLAEQETRIKGVVGWVDVTSPQLTERLARWSQPALCGFRHLVQDEIDPAGWLARPEVARGINQLQRAGYCWDLLVTWRDLNAAAEFAGRHDAHWLVLDHCGKPDIARGARHWAEQVAPLAALPHVACKLSGLITEAGQGWQPETLLPFIDAALSLFGPERLMFGSDWPVCRLAGDYAQVHSLCEQAIGGLSADEQDAIRGGTASRIYQLEV
ncbi:amidohydrolase family protein [Paramixta manurensis]|uniref:amidohydrolase family protein n=1 Tax=Paramixta manurensis TaxID=2740817 RepID=UPI00156B7694